MTEEKSLASVPVEKDDKSLVSVFDILTSTATPMVTPEDVEFLHKHAQKLEKRFRTRPLFRSKTEMLAGVLNDIEHPTPDSKYWQAIGEQNVHLTELISLTYEAGKTEAECQLLEAKIAECEKRMQEALDDITKRKYEALMNKYRIQLGQKKFNLTQAQKVAQERLREIKNWEEIIQTLEPQLKHGDENFELHHPERYVLRYEARSRLLPYMDDSAREATMYNKSSYEKLYAISQGEYNKIIDYLNAPANLQIEAGGEQRYLPQRNPELAPSIEMGENLFQLTANSVDDPVIKDYLKYNNIKILVASPHRAKGDPMATNFKILQTPAATDCMMIETYGYTVEEARNRIVEKALESGADYIFFIDDDVMVPRFALVKLLSHLVDSDEDYVAGGIYHKKYLPIEGVSMILRNGRPRPLNPQYYKIGDIIYDTLVLCGGCSLVKTEIYKKMEPPYYKTVYYENTDKVVMNEDTYFSGKCRQLGVRLITDTSVQGIHLDYINKRFYGHPEIVDHEANVIRGEYAHWYANV